MNNKAIEKHRIKQISWLRAAVLGANDGIISTASLLIGIVSSGMPLNNIIIAGIAGLIAGAMSMAAGEYISVSSQADTEKSELKREKFELETDYASEVSELTNIYIQRGVEDKIARIVAEQLMAKDALAAHARDELGITDTLSARPLQAAIFSAISFTLGSILPIAIIFLVPQANLIMAIWIISILCLAILGAVAAKIGGSKIFLGAIRVVVWGSIAMILGTVIGKLLGIRL